MKVSPKTNHHFRWMIGLAAICTVTIHGLPEARAADITIDSTTLTITGDDADPDRFNGVSFSTEVVNGMARFRVRGNLVIRNTDRIKGTGDRPISIIVAGNVTLEDGAEIDVSAIDLASASIPGPGGGAGATASSGGAGGDGGRRGIIGDRTNGTDGGAGGGGGSGGSAPSGGGTSGDGGKYSLPGQPGTTGDPSPAAGSGSDGFLSAASGGAGGSTGGGGGTGGSGGSAGAQQAGDGGGGGAGGFFSADGGGWGGDATSTAVGHGFLGDFGHTGGSGDGGTNTGTGAMISGGGGGGSGKGGGGGGGGGGGRNGAGGGGGGGGGAAFTVSGTSGGNGGNGGRGGAGGKGGDGGPGGPGGAGGGALEITALGILIANDASLFAKGGSGLPGSSGSPGIDPGSNGEAGKSGQNVTNGDGKGGDGGDGTAGGNGADGRSGGTGGPGGGGGGGSILLGGSVLKAGSGTVVDVRGGSGTNGGYGGRILLAGNSPVNFPGTATGATPEIFEGPKAVNPHVFPANTETPYLPNLLDGVAVAGILRNLNAGSFPDIVLFAPQDSRIALVRMDTGPAGYADDFAGHDLLLFINLTCEDLPFPMLGVGESGQLAPLQFDGPDYLPDFGGVGAVPRSSLPAYCVYATLIPDDIEWFNISYQPTAGVTVADSRRVLFGGAAYLVHGTVTCNAPIPPTGPVLEGDDDPISLVNLSLGASNRLEFEVLGVGSDRWAIETSTDMVNWLPDGAVTLRHGWGKYVATTADATGPRMFRGVRPPGKPVRWATRVIGFSSQFTSTGWSAAQTLGEPDTYPNYGDISTSWASQSADGQREFIELGYDDPAPIRSVSIYETLAPGAVDGISVRNPSSGLWETVWSGTAATAPPDSRIFTVTFPQTAFPVDAIRIEIDSPAVPDWNEIDAVSIE